MQFADSLTTTDPLLPRYGIGFQAADPWATTSAATFSGTGYATDVAGTNGGGLLGLMQSSYSIGIWFNAADSLGGGLLSLDGGQANAAAATGNPAVWLDTAGKVHFAANSTLASLTGASTLAYLTGWHLAVLTVDTSGLLTLTKKVTLYVDGSAQATDSGLTLLSGPLPDTGTPAGPTSPASLRRRLPISTAPSPVPSSPTGAR